VLSVYILAALGFKVFRWLQNRPETPFLVGCQKVLQRGRLLLQFGAAGYRADATTAAVAVGSITIAAICAVSLGATLSTLYDDAIDRSNRESAEFASVLAGQTSHSIEAINLVLEELAQRIASREGEGEGEGDDGLGRFSNQETHLYLKQRLSRLPFADVITIVNSDGHVVNITRTWPTPHVDLSKRDHFEAVKAGAKDLVISDPVLGHLAGETLVFFARRAESSTGTFLGSVIVGAKPDKLIDANAADAHVQGRTLVLARRDGMLLAHSESPKSAGSKFPKSSPWYSLVAHGGGDYRSPGYFDGIARQIVVRPLKNWPLVVNVSEREDAALRTWHQVRRTVVIGGLVASLIGISLVIALMRNLRKLAEAQRTLWKQAYEDPLTVLPNRRQLTDHLDRLLRNGSGGNGAIFFVDLDRFKSVNDSLGHAFGDELLQQVAARLRTLVRKSDIVARIGGDEFVMVVDGADARSAAARADAIIAAIDQPFHLGEENHAHIGASVGIRLFADATGGGERLIDDADRALYQAKLAGRGRYSFYRAGMEAAAREKLVLDARMHGALELCEFGLVYQPIVFVDDNRIAGVEALVRWNDPARGVVLPGEFIALAEETGFIEPLSHWILDTAFAQMANWRAAEQPIDSMAINLSLRHFKSDGFINEIKLLLSKHAIPAQCITLEITESMAMHDEREVNLRLSELRELGFSIALDDFGTGYSSLSVLRYLPIHKLKIDRSFLADVLTDPVANKVTSGIISLAKSVGLAVIAEGIETKGQLELLRVLGCDFAQGYLLGRPMLAADIVAALSAQEPRLKAVA
jgi:diguanylate cyclase (GGDEF)-like protein